MVTGLSLTITKEDTYPEPTMFRELPAFGFFIRHVKGLQMRDVELRYLKEDFRPAFWLNDVAGVDFEHVKAQHPSGVPTFDLKNVVDLSTHHVGRYPKCE